MEIIMTVSYTHLDVYKRQPTKLNTIIEKLRYIKKRKAATYPVSLLDKTGKHNHINASSRHNNTLFKYPTKHPWPTHHNYIFLQIPYPDPRCSFTKLTGTVIIIYSHTRCIYDFMFIRNSFPTTNFYLIPQDFMLLVPYMFS